MTKRLIKKILYWLYIKSGLRKRDEDIYWRGKSYVYSLMARDARIEWTMKLRPELTWDQAKALVLTHDDMVEKFSKENTKAGMLKPDDV